MTMAGLSIEQRLLKHRKIVGGCWVYEGSTNPKGYGQIKYQGKPVQASRISAMLYLGYDLADKEHQINHKRECPNKACFNPEHLYIGTISQNMMDAIIAGSFKRDKTHCKRGHEFNAENTILLVDNFSARPRKRCRICAKLWAAKQRLREE